MVKLIEIKTVQPYFDDIWYGEKGFEIRLDDKNYQVADVLWQREYYPGEDFAKTNGYTERSIMSLVTYKLPAGAFVGLANGYCCMQCEVIRRLTNMPHGLPDMMLPHRRVDEE
jgi:hypothetical protein